MRELTGATHFCCNRFHSQSNRTINKTCGNMVPSITCPSIFICEVRCDLRTLMQVSFITTVYNCIKLLYTTSWTNKTVLQKMMTKQWAMLSLNQTIIKPTIPRYISPYIQSLKSAEQNTKFNQKLYYAHYSSEVLVV